MLTTRNHNTPDGGSNTNHIVLYLTRPGPEPMTYCTNMLTTGNHNTPDGGLVFAESPLIKHTSLRSKNQDRLAQN
jgi:hypothetical protein